MNYKLCYKFSLEITVIFGSTFISLLMIIERFGMF